MLVLLGVHSKLLMSSLPAESKMGKFMEKAGEVLHSDKLQQKGQEKLYEGSKEERNY